ncbi:MAG: TIM barrel protein [Verrucomicrobiota bacterium]
MSKPPQSFSFWCFTGKGVGDRELLELARGLGYAAVELIDESLWPLARDAGLAIASVGGHDGIAHGMNRPENAARIEREVRANLEKAVEWGIPNLICFSGNREGLDDATGLANCAEQLARLAPHAEAAGVTLILEVLNSKVDHADYMADKIGWGAELVERVGSPRVKLLCDLYHTQIMEGDLIRTIGKHHPHIAHYHTAGNPGRGPLDQRQEINYPAVLRAIQATGYRGYIGHELLPPGDPVAALRDAFALTETSLSVPG